MSATSICTRVAALAALLVPMLAAPPLVAQVDDVELLGLMYGTRPPQEYLDARDAGRIPGGGLDFSRGWKARNPSLRATGSGPGGFPRFESVVQAAVGGVPAAVLGQRDGPVEGTFRFPLILGYFADDAGPPAHDASTVQREFFDGPNSRYRTIPEYYDEMSGGRIDLRGETFPWVQSPLTEDETAGTSSGLNHGSRVSPFIRSILASVDDGSVDWGRYDNDGPDGVPNSGDDDGYVDILAVFHPQWGAECGGPGRNDRIWSHKFSLTGAAFFPPEGGDTGPYQTSSVSAAGGFIRVDDYTIQPLISCELGGRINEIGVLAHELGHGFGLPDLYDTSTSAHAAIGRWGLMGQGSWGCSSVNDPARPCGMSAWSRAALGWVEVETLAPDTDHLGVLLDPVATSGQVLRLDARDGSDEYFLLENRQRIGFDGDLPGTGLLLWHVDPDFVNARWPVNSVNTNTGHLGVGLVQADGQGHLQRTGAGSNRGDAGDPFPGSSGTAVFHAGRAPQSFTHEGVAAGVTLTEIEAVGTEIRLRATSGFRSVSVRLEGSTTPGLVLVDDVPLPPGGADLMRAPFEALVLSASSGESLGPGIRRPFLEWAGESTPSTHRVVITPLATNPTYTAVYGGEEVALSVEVEGGVLGVEPGTLATTPAATDLWLPVGAEVSLRATPTAGFAFSAWTGEWAGRPNPFTLTPAAPLTVGMRFELTFPSLAQALVSGSSALDARLIEALDGAGNGDGAYDVGDLRAHLRGGGGS